MTHRAQAPGPRVQQESAPASREVVTWFVGSGEAEQEEVPGVCEGQRLG